MTAQRDVSRAMRPGKRQKKILQPRAARHLGHPHPVDGGYDLHRHPMPDRGATRKPKESKVTKGHGEMVERNLEVLAEAGVARSEVEIYKDKLVEYDMTVGQPANDPSQKKRVAYAALETHREIAATALAAGCTYAEAADWAGTTEGTVSKWYEDADFRARVDERTDIVAKQVGGRILGWMDRRTSDAKKLDESDPRTVLAIYDRVAGKPGGRGERATINIEHANILNYQDLMERSAAAAAGASKQAQGDVVDTGGEGRGFPLIGLGSVPVAGDGTQSE